MTQTQAEFSAPPQRAARRRAGYKLVHQWRKLTSGVRNRITPLEPKPVFILGNQKSGTSAVVCLLGSATGCSFTNDIEEICEPVQGQLHSGTIPLERFIRRTRVPFSRKIIKEPALTFMYPQLAALYPDSAFVLVVRNPVSNIRSVLNRVKMPGSLRDADLAACGIPRDWQRIVDSRWLGAQGEYYIEWMAYRWCMAADVYLQNRDKMLLFRYEDFMADKKQAIESLAGQLGLPLAHDISAELDVQFQPKGDSKADPAAFFGDNLQVIERICASRMEQLGYPPRSPRQV